MSSAAFITGMPFDEYLQIDAENFSGLKVLEESPKHYRHHKEHGRPDTVGLAKGRAVHTLVLEPERFDEDYAVFHGPARRGSYWEAFKSALEGRTILKIDELTQAQEMAHAVRTDPVAGKYFEGAGENEVVLIWTDPTTGIRCKARLDRISYVHNALVDLKGATNVSSRILGAIAAKSFYPQQLCWYRWGLDIVRRELGLPAIEWSEKLVSVEIGDVHDVAVDHLDERMRFIGTEANAALLAKLEECRRTNTWPGKAPVERPLDLPAYAYFNADDEADIDVSGIPSDDDESEAAA